MQQPLLITSRNAVAATGLSWTQVKALAAQYDIEPLVLSPRRTAYVGATFVAALARKAEIAPMNRIEAILRANGLK